MCTGCQSRIWAKVVSSILVCAVLQLYGPISFAQGSLSFDVVKPQATALSTFSGPFAEWQKQYSALRRTVKPTSSQVSSFSAISSTVLSQFPSYQSNLSTYISKLKSMGAWTAALDKSFYDYALKNNINPTVVSHIKLLGGPRMVLEKALAEAPLLSKDINYTVLKFKGLAWFNLDLVPEAMARDEEEMNKWARTALAFAALGIVCAAFAQVLCVVVTTAAAAAAVKETADAAK